MIDRKKITTQQLCELLGISKNTVTKYVRMGRIPAPVVVGGRNVWRESEVLACEDMWFQQARKNVRMKKVA